MTLIYDRKELHRIDYRMALWLLDAMRPDGMVSQGWRQRAMEALRIPNSTLFEAQTRLKAAGVIRFQKYDRALWVNIDPIKRWLWAKGIKK